MLERGKLKLNVFVCIKTMFYDFNSINVLKNEHFGVENRLYQVRTQRFYV